MADFEKFRSSFPSENQQKGEDFEIFLSEWMLKHHPAFKTQFKKVWRFKDWPRAWSSKDLGTDLIAQDQNGLICAIQAKFYKEGNSITKADIDSFLSDSNRSIVDYRLLIATTDDIGRNAIKTIEGQEKPVQSFTLKDFYRPFEWPESYDKIKDYTHAKPKKPRPHQELAINNVVKKIDKRGQLIMACGTGKTLTGQRICEKLDSQITLVLVPSLLLLAKTIYEWISEKEKDFIFLPVCSDKTVSKKADELSLSDADLFFKPTTKTEEILDFLKKKGRKVIFATYQSSPVIASTCKDNRVPAFDLVIADEAHRCAGKISSDYGTILSDSLIPAKKRIFMTATPRIYSSNLKKQAEGFGEEIISMDDEVAFGPVLHELLFSEAISSKPPLLCDYKVIVIGVNNQMIQGIVDKRELVKTKDGLESDAKTVATQVGISIGLRKYGLRKLISFHSRVEQSRKFSESFTLLQKSLPRIFKPRGEVNYTYISGAMPSSLRLKRLKVLQNLVKNQIAIVGNARCLSEGVDVPSLDGIIFTDPKSSQIDIIQATGRAIRLSEGKEYGYIIIPVFIADGDDPDDVLLLSEFEKVWKVLRALRSHDSALGDFLDNLRISLGSKKKITLKGSKIVLDLPRLIGKEFINSFTTRLVEQASDSWEFNFGQMKSFIEKHGHQQVPQDKKYNQLNSWISRQRILFKKNLLRRDREEKLQSIEFCWDPQELRWFSEYKKLHILVQKNGIGFLSSTKFHKMKLSDDLKGWMSRQRSDFKKGNLNENRQKLLDEIGFIWDELELKFAIGLESLRLWNLKNSQKMVPVSFKDKNGFPLGRWIKNLRSLKKSNKLSKTKVEALEEVGIIWNRITEFDKKFWDSLNNFFKKKGHIRVPKSFVDKTLDFQLGNAFSKIIYKHRKGELDQEIEKRISQFHNFANIAKKYTWEDRYKQTEAYLKKHKCSAIRPDYRTEDNFCLGRWVQKQKVLMREGDLSSEQKENFLKLFPEKLISWNNGFSNLVIFKKEFKHTVIPPNYITKDGFKLGQWNGMILKLFESNKLEKKKLNELEELKWNSQFSDSFSVGLFFFARYVKKLKTALVPKKYITIESFPLGSWIGTIRQSKKKGKLSKDKETKLQKLGFVWDTKKKDVNHGLEAYLEYISLGNDPRVKKGIIYKEINLHNFYHNTRKRYSKLKPEERKRLDEIDFMNLQSPKEEQWEVMFETLKKWCDKNDGVPNDKDPKLKRWYYWQKYKFDKISELRKKKLKGLPLFKDFIG